MGCSVATASRKIIVRPGQQNIQRNLIRRLLPRRAFHQLDHPVQERFARIRRDAHLDFIRQYARAAGHRRAIAARFANHRRRLSGDRGFVHRGDSLNHFAVPGNEFRRRYHHHVAQPQLRTGHRFDRAIRAYSPRNRFRPRPPQRLGLGFPAPLRHRFRKIREQHGEPQPHRNLQRESESLGMCWISPRTRSTEVSTAPTSTTNITGFFARVRGFNFTSEDPSAGTTMSWPQRDFSLLLLFVEVTMVS